MINVGLAQTSTALRQEGHVYRVRLLRMPPSARRVMCASTIHTLGLVTDMTLLTEGGCYAGENYKHDPPDGGGILLRRYCLVSEGV